MKHINTYIVEKLKITKPKKVEYTLFPTTFGELDKMIRDEIKQNGNNCSLNHIDISKFTNISYLFYSADFKNFNGDISRWDVSNVVNMEGMFEGSNFNGDISDWDVSKVENMNGMFYNSMFNGDISRWDVSNVMNMGNMFEHSVFNQDISRWNVSKVMNMANMFKRSEFNQDISKWDVSNVGNIKRMFEDSKFNQDISNWNIDKCMPIDNMICVFTGCPIKNEYKPDIFRD